MNEAFLRSNGIRCIINAAGDLERTHVQVDGYMQLNALDAMDYPILRECGDRAHQGLALAMSQNMPTLIHCAMGINRSAILLADYIATITGRGARDVLVWIRSLRPIVFSNPSFVRQLIEKHG